MPKPKDDRISLDSVKDKIFPNVKLGPRLFEGANVTRGILSTCISLTFFMMPALRFEKVI